MSIFGEHNDDLSLDDLVPRKTQIMAGMLRPRTQTQKQLLQVCQLAVVEMERMYIAQPAEHLAENRLYKMATQILSQLTHEEEPPVDTEEVQD